MTLGSCHASSGVDNCHYIIKCYFIWHNPVIKKECANCAHRNGISYEMNIFGEMRLQ